MPLGLLKGRDVWDIQMSPILALGHGDLSLLPWVRHRANRSLALASGRPLGRGFGLRLSAWRSYAYTLTTRSFTTENGVCRISTA
jgi:hypothetical protein